MVLRKGLTASMKDPTLVADAHERDTDLDDLTGEKVEALVRKTIDAPQKVVERFREALDLDSSQS